METEHRSLNGEDMLQRQSSTVPAVTAYLLRPLRSEADVRRAKGQQMRREAERFYERIPEHVWAEIHAVEAMPRRTVEPTLADKITEARAQLGAARADLKKVLRFVNQWRGDREGRQFSARNAGFSVVWRRYRKAQSELRALMDERWKMRLSELGAAE